MQCRGGDVIEVEIDCEQNELTVRNITEDKMNVSEFPVGKQWRLHVNTSFPGDSVRITDMKM